MADQGSAKARYEKLSKDRSQFLQRARHNALLTIPSLMPLDGQSGRSHLVEPYQGVGSRAIVHLSSRMLVGLIPAGRPYMRLDLPPELKMEHGGEVPVEITKGLALSEQLVQAEVEAKAWRQSTLMSLQQLMMAGNAVEFMQDDNTIRVYRLDQFVVRRDHHGRVLELIIMEKFPKDATPLGMTPPSSIGMRDKDEEVELYTTVKLVPEVNRTFYRRTQEWGSGEKAGDSATWPVNEVPYLVLRWSATPGEDYGRSKVEEHIADLRSLDALEKAQLEMAAMASRNFIVVRPGANAAGLKRRLTQAVNGDVVTGDPDGIELKSFDNAGGYQITASQVQVLRESLSSAFLLMSGAQRDAERVTATEIERDIQELEAALGGTFSTLSQEMMEVRTRILIQNMKAQGKLPQFPDGAVVPTILTGLEALSRERDVSRAMQAAEIANAFGETAVDSIKLDRILSRAYIGLGFPDAVRTEAEAQQFRQQRQQAEMLAQGAAGAIPQIAKGAMEQGANNG